MPNKTITKIGAFVIFAGLAFFGMTGCDFLSRNGAAQSSSKQGKAPYDPPKIIGKIESEEIDESSGLAASKCQPDVFWTHNDSGGGAFIFAVNLKGENLGTWKVAGATNRDWEDIAETKDAAGKCFVYIGEIGNNSLGREEGIVYRIAEPIVTDQTRSTTMSEPQTTANADTLRFSYSDTTHNAETLLVHPVSGDIYIVTKSKSGPAGVYKLKPDFGGDKQTAQKIADISVPAVPDGVITGGDISPDGKRVVLCDYFSGYELSLSADAKDFDNIWKEKPLRFEAGDRDTGESITYTADGQSVIAGSEKKYSPLFQIKRSRQMITGSRLQLWKRPTFRS